MKPEYIVYFTKEMVGYIQITANDENDLKDKIHEFELKGNFDKRLDKIKDNGWTFEDYEEM